LEGWDRDHHRAPRRERSAPRRPYIDDANLFDPTTRFSETEVSGGGVGSPGCGGNADRDGGNITDAR
jgi:hypothetical protein